MAEEPFFLVNEFLEGERKDIELILDGLSIKGFRKNERAVFIQNFTDELFKAYRKTKKIRNIEHEKEAINAKKEKALLLKKKLELVKKLKNLETKTVPNTPVEKKEVILSKETGKTLAGAEFVNNHYNIKEPELQLQDNYVLHDIESNGNINFDDKQGFTDLVKSTCEKYNVHYDESVLEKIRYYVIRDLKKYGKISALIEDKDVKEIICNGFNQPLIISYKEQQDIPTNIEFYTEEELNDFILNLAKEKNQNVSVENPFFNSSLNGLNIQGTLGSEFVKAKFIISKV